MSYAGTSGGVAICYDPGQYDSIKCQPVTGRALVAVYTSKDVPSNKSTLREFIARIGEGTWRDFKQTNASFGGKAAKFGAGVLVGGAIAARYESYTPLKWALRGFGAVPAEFTKSGAIQVFQYTTAQRALLVGKAAAAKFVLVTVAFEGGVLICLLYTSPSPRD